MDDGDPMLDVLVEALHARPEIAQRADRCRAVLADLLASRVHAHQRELNLLVTAVEQGVPTALLATLGSSDYDAISGQLSAERALELDAARWVVRTWSAALLSVSGASPESLAPIIDAATPAAATAPPNPSALVTPMVSHGDSTVETAGPRGDLWEMAARNSTAADSRRRQPWNRQRKRILAVGSGAVAVVVIAVGAVAFGTGGSKKAASPTSSSTSAAPVTTTTVKVVTTPLQTELKYPTAAIGSGVKVTRTWTLSGSTGGTFMGKLNFVAAKQLSKPILYDEVIPESLAASSSDVNVFYDSASFTKRPTWVKKDPILRITLGFAKSKTITVSYHVTVPAKGRGASRLQGWRKAQATAQYLWILAHQANLVPVPNVLGEDSATAATQLAHASFVVSIQYAKSTTVAKNRVISTSPGPNVLAAKGSTVTLVVSTATGPPPQLVTVKNVIGEALSQAQADLARLGFNGSVIYVTDAARVGQVISEAPQGGTQQPKGTTIVLTVGTAAPSTITSTTTTTTTTPRTTTTPTTPPPVTLTGLSGPRDQTCEANFPYTATWTVSWTGGHPQTVTWRYDNAPAQSGTSISLTRVIASPTTGSIAVYATGSDNKQSNTLSLEFTILPC
jgi:PASTA domain